MLTKSLKEICQAAMAIGQGLDLSDCQYGETTNDKFFLDRPTNYYFFLAGFVRSEKLGRVLEIGTNFGGSIMAISKGLEDFVTEKICLATVDITNKNIEGFKKYPQIKRVHGDSLDCEVIKKTIGLFDKKIDLLYIDSLHKYEHTKDNMNIYSDKLNPRYVVLDDIHQCQDMKRLWSELTSTFGDNAFDASEVAIRRGAGFGVIRRY